MKNIILLTIIYVIIFAFVACGGDAGKNGEKNASNSGNAPTNTAENKTSANSANSANKETASNSPEISDEEAEKMMNEDISGVDTSKPMPAGDLFDKFSANESDIKDKPVAVSGKFAMYGTSYSEINNKKSAFRFEIKDDKGSVDCILKEKPKEADQIQKRKDFSKGVYLTMKGIPRKTVDAMMGGKAVVLEPCEIVKMEEK